MSLKDLPPGIIYLLTRLPSFAVPSLVTYVTAHTARRFCSLEIPKWLLVLSVSLSFPVTCTLRILLEDLFDHIAAYRLGATMPPRLKDPYPGGLRTLSRGVMAFKNGRLGALATLLWLHQKTWKHIFIGDILGFGFEMYAAEVGGRTFNTRTLFQNRIVTDEPEHLKAILATQFDNHDKGPEVGYVFYPLLGTGVFNADGELWKFHRTLTRPFFTRERLSSTLHMSALAKHSDLVLTALKSRLREGHPVDFQEVASRFTLNCALEILLGYRAADEGPNTLAYPFYVERDPPEKAGDQDLVSLDAKHEAVTLPDFVKAFVRAQQVTSHRMRYSVHWPLAEFWEDKLKKPMKIVHDFIDGIVQQALDRKNKFIEGRDGRRENDENLTLLENLVKETEDPIILRDEILNILVAGRDTTASLLTFSIYMLGDHPNVLQNLRNEIMEQIGPDRLPTAEDLKGMKYLRAVLNETLRLYPPVPFNVRMTNKPTVWQNREGKPYYIPANSRVPFSLYNMHRRKDLWGPDALDFDPNRFLDERLHTYLVPNPFIFLPFNAGPRICLGQQFAYNEASFFVVRLLQEFQSIALVPEAIPIGSRPPREWADDDRQRGATRREKIRPKTHLTMYVDKGLWVTMRQATYNRSASQ